MTRTRQSLTILIAARNAAATIERAVSSCLPEDCRIVLADDHSQDETIALARALAGPGLHVVRTPDPGGVATARQCALDEVDTPFAAWLDGDDAWIPGRADRLTALLEAGSDVATESIDLHDGPSGARLRRLEAPSFVRVPGGQVRLFERNCLSGDTQVAFRAQTYRVAGGYDPCLQGPESFDLLLRALRNGARLGFSDEVGYRMYAYPGSLSRGLARQRAALATALRKHPYEDVRQLYRSTGYNERIATWALVVLAQFREDPDAALGYLDAASPVDASPGEVLEAEGPWPFCEGWRRAFHRGTILLTLAGREEEAADELRRAESIAPTPEGANNLGVALATLGYRSAAADAFAAATARFPGYLDAAINSSAPVPSRVTSHPLRHIPSRLEYT